MTAFGEKFLKLFKSKEELDTEYRLKMKSLGRRLDNAIEKINASVASLEAKRDKFWEEAKAALRVGQIVKKNRALLNYKRYDTLAQKQMNRVAWLEGKQVEFATAGTVGDAVTALADLAKSFNISPEVLERQLDELSMSSDIVEDTNAVLDKEVSADMNNQANVLSTEVEVDSDLNRALELEVLGATSESGKTAEISQNVVDSANEGLNKLKAMVSGVD